MCKFVRWLFGVPPKKVVPPWPVSKPVVFPPVKPVEKPPVVVPAPPPAKPALLSQDVVRQAVDVLWRNHAGKGLTPYHSLVDLLIVLGWNHDFGGRKTLWSKFFPTEDYHGRALQNSRLLRAVLEDLRRPDEFHRVFYRPT